MNRVLPFPLHPSVDSIVPYVPGRPTEEVERELGLRETVKLASNENPLGPSPRAIEAMRAALSQVNRYPDGGAYYLRQRLSQEVGVPAECLIIGNGSTEIVEMIAKAFLPPDGESLVSEGAFIMYRIASLAAAAVVRTVQMTTDLRHDLPAMAAAVGPKTRLVFIANPNNPTGTRVSTTELDAYFDAVPPTVITVLDEAYREYIEASDYPDGTEALRAGHRVVVLRTFSKIHGLAGLRVGYGVAAPEVVSSLEKVRSPFNSGSVGQVAARAALGDTEHILRSRKENTRELRRVEAALRAGDIEYVPSSTNFVMMRPGIPGERAFQALLQQGVIVRPLGGYGFGDHLRVSIGTAAENDRFLAALGRIRPECDPAGS